MHFCMWLDRLRQPISQRLHLASLRSSLVQATKRAADARTEPVDGATAYQTIMGCTSRAWLGRMQASKRVHGTPNRYSTPYCAALPWPPSDTALVQQLHIRTPQSTNTFQQQAYHEPHDTVAAQSGTVSLTCLSNPHVPRPTGTSTPKVHGNHLTTDTKVGYR
jgi:hypothetical protein